MTSYTTCWDPISPARVHGTARPTEVNMNPSGALMARRLTARRTRWANDAGGVNTPPP